MIDLTHEQMTRQKPSLPGFYVCEHTITRNRKIVEVVQYSDGMLCLFQPGNVRSNQIAKMKDDFMYSQRIVI